jgi:hypothetical protein
MANARDPSGTADRPERRCGHDRRGADKGPPGQHERRRHVEPRRPEVAEIDMSHSEWGALSEGLPRPPPSTAPAKK